MRLCYQGATLKQRTRSYTFHRMQKIQEKTHERLVTLKFHPTFRMERLSILQRELIKNCLGLLSLGTVVIFRFLRHHDKTGYWHSRLYHGSQPRLHRVILHWSVYCPALQSNAFFSDKSQHYRLTLTGFQPS